MSRGFLGHLASMVDDGDEPRPPRVAHVGQIARLREFGERLDAGCPFAVGDLVTPRADAPIRLKGAPRLVVEVVGGGGEPTFVGTEAGDFAFGARYDVRVVYMRRDGYLCLTWAESVYFETYDPAAHEHNDRED